VDLSWPARASPLVFFRARSTPLLPYELIDLSGIHERLDALMRRILEGRVSPIVLFKAYETIVQEEISKAVDRGFHLGLEWTLNVLNGSESLEEATFLIRARLDPDFKAVMASSGKKEG